VIGRHAPAFGFWLNYLDSRGGLWEQSGDTVLAILPEHLSATHDLPDTALITDDPDISREDGVLFLGAGHPAIDKAAEAVIDTGDVGVLTMPHRSQPLSTEALLARIREQVPVDHGRIDATGAPIRSHRPLLRLGVLVSHTVSAEEQFTEVAECLLDVRSRTAWPEDAADRLHSALATADSTTGRGGEVAPLAVALAAAHQVLDTAAARRGRVLAAGADTEREADLTRAGEYYAAALAAIDKRRTGADPKRQALLDARAQATIAERDRRLAEISEKYRHQHGLRPYRLHLIEVPVWRLATDVRRGDRRWPMVFDYLPLLGTVAPTRCPVCDAHAPLVATKTHLGCGTCLAARTSVPPTTTAPSPTPLSPKPPARPAPDGPQQAAKAVPASGDQQSRPVAPATSRKQHGTRTVQPTASVTTTTARQAGATRPFLPGKPEERKVIDFWNHLGAGEHRKLGRLIAPDSPLAALTRLYSGSGPLHGIGVPASHTPVKFTYGNYDQPLAGQRGGTGGTLHTAHGEYTYLLLWSPNRLLEEIFPYSAPWSLGMAARMRRPPVTQAPPPLVDLDTVAKLLLTRTTARHGLTFAARALAAWWRLPNPDDLLARFAPRVLAATLDRAIRYWSSGQATYPEAAEAFHAEENAIRKATPVLQKYLQLSNTRNW
jgi:hypothetical protein